MTAVDLHERGWHPVTVKLGQKTPPAEGRTGYDGHNMTLAEIEALDSSQHSIAVRMPDHVIGIDVDAYHRGDTTLAGLVAEHGPLPPTAMTTARSDGSGIRFYLTPAGTMLTTKITPGIEIVQWFHRYAMVSPSTNPKFGDTPYRWIDEQSGEILDDPPRVEDLPELPWSWIEALTVHGKGKKAGSTATPAEVREFLDQHVEAHHPGALKGPQRRLAAVTPDRYGNEAGGRHDTALEVACWTMREARAGLYTAADAVDMLEGWWSTAVSDDKGRSDEIGSILVWAIAEALAEDPERIAEIQDRAAAGLEAWKQAQAKRKRDALARWIEECSI